MPQVNQTPVSPKNNEGIMMDVMEKIRKKIDVTREEVIKLGVRQEEDRRRHDERHLENKEWVKSHNKRHDDIMDQLKEVNEQTSKIIPVQPSKPIDKNLLIKLGFVGLFLLIGLIYALTGNEMPSIIDLTAVAGSSQ